MKRVLIVQPFGIGDAIFLTPLIRSLKKDGCVEKVDLLLGSRTREVFEENPYVNEIFSLDRDELRRQGFWRSFFEILKLIALLRKGKYDLLVDCSLSRNYSFFAKFFVWIPKRIGFDYKKRGLFLTEKIALPFGYKDKHVIQYYMELGNLVGLHVSDGKPDFFTSDQEKKRAAEFLEHQGLSTKSSFIVVAPGGGESWGKDAHFKRWKPSFFADLIDKISKELEFDAVVVLGSSAEFDLGEEVISTLTVKRPSFNLCGKISLRESAALLKKALFLLANDSGMVHVARALEVPLVGLYGPVDEKVYGPYPLGPQYLALGREGLECRPCYQSFRYNAACEHRECLTRWYPDQVLDKILKSGFLSQLGQMKLTARVGRTF